MYDDLAKRLRGAAISADSGNEISESLYSDILQAADAIEKLQRLVGANKTSRWIPVTERLPEKTGVYLAWMKWDLTEPEEEPSAYSIEYDAEEEAFGWWKSYYDAETLGWAGEDFIRYEGITHWMPLPEPPKEET